MFALSLAAITVGYVLTGSSAFAGGARTVASIVAGMLATFGVDHLRLRRQAAAAAGRSE